MATPNLINVAAIRPLLKAGDLTTSDTALVDCDADDYFEAFVYQTTAGAQDIIGEVRQTYFGGFKIIT